MRNFQRFKTITADVVRQYGLDSANRIVTHREIAGEDYTDCPGAYFPAEAVREFIRSGGTAQPEANALAWKVCVDTLNLREGPDLAAKVLGVLHCGDTVELERYVQGENWARVNAGGKTGWVWLRFIGEKGA